MRSLAHVLLLLSILAVRVEGYSQSIIPGVNVRDCVQVRYITGVWMNPQGTRVAYLLKSPNLKDNRNNFELYVKDLQDKTTAPGKLLMAGADISSTKWLGDNRHLTMLVPIQGIRSLVSVNIENGSRETLLTLNREVQDYSVDESARTVAYSVSDKALGTHLASTHTEEEVASGYRIRPFDASPTDTTNTSSIYVKRRRPDGNWSSPELVSFVEPFTHRTLTHLTGPIEFLNISPDGKKLALNYWTDNPLTSWRDSPWVRFSLSHNRLNRVMVIQDLARKTTSLGFPTVYPDSTPVWSSDSKSFLMNAHSPVGSSWEKDDIRDHRTAGLDANLFWVDVDTGKVEEVFRHVPDHHEEPMFWQDDGDVIVHMLGNVVAHFHHDNGSWHEVNRLTIPSQPKDQFWYLNSNGQSIVGVHQSITTPEDLFLYQPSEKNVTIITDLNPQLKQVRFAPVREVSWATPEGLAIDGLLFMPPNYVPGKRYPLVIQTKGDQGQFTCDSGPNHDPSFAPQPLANAGIMYLARTAKAGYNQQDDNAAAPKGYPGQLGIAAQQMEIWDSAVTSLDQQGLIDPTRVGIVGFSATGYYVEFALAHSRFRYAAATAADNTQRSFSDYWLFPPSMSDLDGVFGGPPYGKTLKNWLDYSISFNLDKVHTPLLMESMGYGVQNDIEGSIPIALASRLELYTGLSRLGKPIELYYYPNEAHTPDHPKARLASLQRNLDWYRFWLQGYEDPDVTKTDQYKRWRHLRELHAADVGTADNDKSSGSGFVPEQR